MIHVTERTLVSASDLSLRDLHDLLQLRCAVFVLEQSCAYADIDGRDLQSGTRHALLRERVELIGCARALAPMTVDEHGVPDGVDSDDWRIGRLAVASGARRRGFGRQLLAMLVDDIELHAPGAAICLDAQLQAETLYANAGFKRIGNEFIEDGIAHVTMRRAPSRT